MVALPLLLMLAVVAGKVAEDAVAPTVTDAGTVNAELLLDSVTFTLVGVACVKVTVQVLEAFGPRLVGLQETAEISTGAAKVTAVLAELLL